MLLSVVIPCYNEEAVIEETHKRLSAALKSLAPVQYETIFVDDGSRDKTAEILRRLHESDEHVRVLRFSRNFGHQTAVSAGIENANGDAVVLIDADLQDPPELIGEFLARWREGYDVAYGFRTDRAGETAFKRSTAKAFYRLLNRLSETEIPLDVGDFRLMDRKVVDALVSMPERARFIRGMVSWVGFRQIAVPYSRAERWAGETKYPLIKMLKFAIDGMTSFSTVPLRIATYAGVMASFISLLGIIMAIFVRLFTKEWVPGWAALFVAILFVGGVQLLALGIIGEYVGRIYAEAKKRPLYLLSERLGFGGPTDDARTERGMQRRDIAPSAREVEDANVRESTRSTTAGAR